MWVQFAFSGQVSASQTLLVPKNYLGMLLKLTIILLNLIFTMCLQFRKHTSICIACHICSPAPTSEYLSLSISAGFCCLTSQAKCIGLKPPPLTCAQFPGVGPTGWFPCWCWLGLLLIYGQLQGARLLSPWQCCLLTWAMESTGPHVSHHHPTG